MLNAVEIEKKKPSDVYAKRLTELKKVTWDKWLAKVDKIIKTINIGQVDIENEEARTVTQEVLMLIAKLDERDANLGGYNAK
jgi:hypothetical protein